MKIVNNGVTRAMVRLIDEAKRLIRSKTKDEWQAFFLAKVVCVRTYIQEHGEKAAIAGFIAGILLILFYKLFVLILTLAVLGYLIIITLADSE
jgi:hypothetical protein